MGFCREAVAHSQDSRVHRVYVALLLALGLENFSTSSQGEFHTSRSWCSARVRVENPFESYHVYQKPTLAGNQSVERFKRLAVCLCSSRKCGKSFSVEVLLKDFISLLRCANRNAEYKSR